MSKATILAVVLLTGVALFLAPAASAANLISNPGFEADLDANAIPDAWSAFADPLASATIARDTVSPRSGAASVRVQTTSLTDTSHVGGAQSTCITGITPETTYFISFWVRDNDPNTFSVAMWVDFYSDASCMTFLSTGIPGFGVGADHQNTWNFWSTSAASPAGAQSARVFLGVRCNAVGTCTANFDDVFFDSQPLAATFTGLNATRSKRGVVVRWRTASEVDVLGFHVYRQVGGRRVKVNRFLIPATGGVVGARYSYLDRRPAAGARGRYWIREIDVNGRGTWHGPAVVRNS